MLMPATPSNRPASRPTRRTQLERRTEAESRLLHSAREIVARKGWIGMTLTEVGESAGYSRGLAAHHFGSKPGLLRALANHINENFMREVQRAPLAEDGLPALLQFITTYLSRKDAAWTNTRALLLLMSEASTEGSETGDILSTYNRQVLGYLEAHIKAGIKRGNVRADADPTPYAILIMGSLRGVMLQKLLKDSKINLKRVRDSLVEMVTRSLAPDGHTR